MKQSCVVLSVLIFLLSCNKSDIGINSQNDNNKSEISVTGRATNITPFSVELTCYANLSFETSNDITIGVLCSEQPDPTIDNAQNYTTDEVDDDAKYIIYAYNLKPNTKYFYRSYVMQNGIYRYGKVKDFQTKVNNIVFTNPATEISTISAKLSGMFQNSEYPISEFGFCYSSIENTPTIGNESTYRIKAIATNQENDFSVSISKLSSNLTYYYRAYVITCNSVVYGDVLSFSTSDSKLIITGIADKQNHISVNLHGELKLEDCVYKTLKYGFCFSEDNSSPTLEGPSITVNESTLSNFNITVTSLLPNTHYYYRAFAIIDDVAYYGDVKQFETRLLFKESTISNISPASATIQTELNLTEEDLYDNTQFGFYYSKEPDILESASKSTFAMKENSILGILSKLESNTQYYFKPWAILDGQETTGPISSFKTLSLVKETIIDEITPISLTVSTIFNNNELDKSSIYGVCYSTSFNPTIYSENAQGAIDNEGHMSIKLSRLLSKTTYFIRPYAIIDGIVHYGEITSGQTKNLFKDSYMDNISPISLTAHVTYNLEDCDYTSASFGICYNSEGTPTMESLSKMGTLTKNSIHVNISAIKASTSYQYRAFAIIDGITHYDNINQFATLSPQYIQYKEATSITHNSADLSVIFSLGNSIYNSISSGFCYALSPNVNVANSTCTSTELDNLGKAKTTIYNLLAYHKYYYKPYIILDGQIFYGEESVFQTEIDPFVLKELESGRLVDLGLSVHWASYNLGAEKNTDIGNYYAWGESSYKLDYTWKSYKHYSGDTYTGEPIISKYKSKDSILEKVDDPAFSEWGGLYRMPTLAEFKELIEKCNITFTTISDTQGYLVTGPSGKSIFLCFTGRKNGTDIEALDYFGEYWLNTLWNEPSYTGQPKYAYWIDFSNTSFKYYWGERYIGRAIRAVCTYK